MFNLRQAFPGIHQGAHHPGRDRARSELQGLSAMQFKHIPHFGKLTALRFNPKENPHPPTGNLKEHENENPTLMFGKPPKPRDGTAEPVETNGKINRDCPVIRAVREVAVATQSIRMLRIAAGSGEKTQIPILAHIPVEGIRRVDKTENCSGRGMSE